MNIREIERKLNKKTSELTILLNEINELEIAKNNYYIKQKAHCEEIKMILENGNHIPNIL